MNLKSVPDLEQPVRTDAFVATGTECRESAGICDEPEECTGLGAACPDDAFVATGTECRDSAGICDEPEECTGLGAACPDDAFVATGTECREFSRDL